ncbi:MAG TPA: S8/S53 family peptidase, partial [Pyrinomonadaceae bacterium]|nr:S8/S53 family peptidase [Pyrinomonadaceae bacterium]
MSKRLARTTKTTALATGTLTRAAKKLKPARRRDPLPKVKFTVQLRAGQDLKKARDCVEITLGTKLAETFPDLVRFKGTIWDYDPRDKKGRLADHLVDEKTLTRRRRELAAGRAVGLPLRLEKAFAGADKKVPKLGSDIIKQEFAVLSLPIPVRTFRRGKCNPEGKLFDASYVLRDACGFASVTPSLAHPLALLQGGPPSLFPPRSPAPPQSSVPSRASWHLTNIMAAGLPPAANGFGVTIGHPDTGWTPHPQLNFNAAGVSPNFPAGLAVDLLEPNTPSAPEPVTGPVSPLALNRFHGTRTASMMVSTRDSVVNGLAPAAAVMSLRCVHNVVNTPVEPDDQLIGLAVVTAVMRGAQVISISLGGLPSPYLRWAIQYAVLNNVIVVAAAGNFWPAVVYPAAYPECIAVGGSTADDMNWMYSARNWLGPAIDISAPSEFIVNATWNAAGVPTTGTNHGTSFGT